MARVSVARRGRGGRRSSNRTRRFTPAPEVCDCPSCSGAEFDPQELIDDLAGSAAELAGVDDPLEAELAGGALLAIGQLAGEGFEEALVAGFIPRFEAQADTGAMVMLLVIGAVAEGKAAETAAAAASRLAAAGVPAPRWAAELREPVTVGECVRLHDAEGSVSVLIGTFQRAGRSHAFVAMVNHLHCGAADELLLVPDEVVPTVLAGLPAQVRAGGVEVTREVLEPAEFRWQVECALDARAVHDSQQLGPELDEVAIVDENGPGYPTVAVLLHSRLAYLPVLDRPKPPHDDDGRSAQAAWQAMQQWVGAGAPLPLPQLAGGADAWEPLPARRTVTDGPAPVYRLRVDLRGTKPPIWRRLEVRADTSLADLHEIIQVAFDWHGLHLHVFEALYGEFGIEDSELGHQPAASVTLEQVAPQGQGKLRYTYDFGDDWEHDIRVEKVLDGDPAAPYPRCTGGRRAAPPEDCGGVWGYADLVASGAIDDAAAFDAATVTRRLAATMST